MVAHEFFSFTCSHLKSHIWRHRLRESEIWKLESETAVTTAIQASAWNRQTLPMAWLSFFHHLGWSSQGSLTEHLYLNIWGQVSLFQISDFRFDVSVSRFQIWCFQISEPRFQTSVSRFQISDFSSLVSYFWFQIAEFRFKTSDWWFQQQCIFNTASLKCWCVSKD